MEVNVQWRPSEVRYRNRIPWTTVIMKEGAKGTGPEGQSLILQETEILALMSMEETQKRLKDLLSKGASQEEMLKQLSLAEGCGLKLWCQEQINPSTGKKIHRWCGYVMKCEDPSLNITEPVCGGWIEGSCPEK